MGISETTRFISVLLWGRMRKFGNKKPFNTFGVGVSVRSSRIDIPVPKVSFTKIDNEPALEMMMVHGRMAGSKYEWRVSQALDNMKVRYNYQYIIMGGAERRGGQIIDFLLDTPRPIILDVKGRYWHTGVHEDLMQSYELERLMPWADYLAMWDEQCETVQTAEAFLRQHVSV